MLDWWVILISVVVGLALIAAIIVFLTSIDKKRTSNSYRRGLDLVPFLIHLPPSTDDIQGGGRDERDIMNEAISQAQIMYSVIASTFTENWHNKMFGQEHFSFEIVANAGLIKYFVLIPKEQIDIVQQAITSAYPTARLEQTDRENIFSENSGLKGVVGEELKLKKDFVYPINTYEDLKRDANLAILNAMSMTKQNEGMGVQILLRPAGDGWIKKSTERVQDLKNGTTKKKTVERTGNLVADIIRAPFEVPEAHEKTEKTETKPLTNLEQEEITAIENKTKYPAFEVLIRLVASTESEARSRAILGSVSSAFAQFDSTHFNGFKVDLIQDTKELVKKYILRIFPYNERTNILNSVELASIFHLPEQNAIPNSRVERQLTKQVDGPARVATEGLFLGTNEFRGEKKEIFLSDDDRRRHLYAIGQTGMGKSVFLENLAYQDMRDGRGFAFIDPHGDAVEAILQRVPKERIDDVIYFDPADIEHPVGMNMFEFTDDDQKDFIVQEGISMLQSLFDPQNQGVFGPRGQHMFRNAALLLMADPNGATFIDIPQCFTDPEFVKSKLKYVTDKAVYDYWTKEFPASQRSNDAGEVTTWFASKWGPFLSNTIMRNILGQTKSGFNIREIMDNKKIFLVNLSKGRLGDVNANLLGMIFVMKFQQAAMSRQDIPESERQDFCLYVDEFQNFATDSFESILSEARKYRLNLIVANQFMTQLTDKIREALLGNVGTIICGRIGITDADMMVKAFSPVFTAEDLTKTANHEAICKVMIYGMPSSPFTMHLPAPMGEANVELMEELKRYSATRYGRARREVEEEINRRWEIGKKAKEVVENIAPDALAASSAPLEPESAVRQPKKLKTPQKRSSEPKTTFRNNNFIDDWLKTQQNQESEHLMKEDNRLKINADSATDSKKEGVIRFR